MWVILSSPQVGTYTNIFNVLLANSVLRAGAKRVIISISKPNAAKMSENIEHVSIICSEISRASVCDSNKHIVLWFVIFSFLSFVKENYRCVFFSHAASSFVIHL